MLGDSDVKCPVCNKWDVDDGKPCIFCEGKTKHNLDVIHSKKSLFHKRHISIDKGIEIPDPKNKYSYILDALKLCSKGDSFVLIDENEKNQVYLFAKALGINITTRTTHEAGSYNSFRVWVL